jgi:hypothetical protein
MSVIKVINVRTLNGQEEKLNVDNLQDFNGFIEQLKSTFAFDSDRVVKLIYKGKVVNQNDFQTIPDKSVVICMATRPPRPANTNINTDINTATNVEPESKQSELTEEKYGFMNIKAYTVVFLNFIASNPQLKDAFLNNYGLLATEIAKSPQLESVMKSILSQSSEISKSMESGENIKVNINMDKENPGMEKLELTKNDECAIDQLIALGFHPDKVLVEYLKAGKDISKTLTNLQI